MCVQIGDYDPEIKDDIRMESKSVWIALFITYIFISLSRANTHQKF